MKEKLITLRDLMTEYSEKEKEFESKKEQFNEDTKTTMVVLTTEVMPANYEAAKMFYDEYTLLIEFADKLKKEHPRYGEKRVNETLLEMFNNEPSYSAHKLCASQIVGAYITFEKFGFRELRSLENKKDELAVKLASNVSDVKTNTIDKASESIKEVVETAKPYGEMAKKQLEHFGGFAKNMIGKGAKKLIKILEEDKNSPKDE